MSDSNRRRLISFFLICNLLLFIAFLIVFSRFHDAFYFYFSSFFRKCTDAEWEMLLQSGEDPNRIITMISEIVGFTVCIINLFGINHLLYGHLYGDIILPIRRVWKVVIPLAGLLLYTPFFYYIKYMADYFHLYMLLVPAEFLSLILLALGIVGLKSLKQQSSK